MKNKKGFTLVELLAVIVILAVLVAVASPLVLSASKRTKQKLFDAKKKMIEAAAVMCMEREKDINMCNSVRVITDKNYIAKENGGYPKNPVNSNDMQSCKIVITNTAAGRYSATLNGKDTSGSDNSACKRD